MKLKDEDIKTRLVSSRRKFLSKVGAGAVGAAAIVAGGAAHARDAKDFVPADNKSQDLDRSNKADKKHDTDKRSGDQA